MQGEDIFSYTDEQAAAALASAKEYAYSKAQSLTAETAALYGKDATAVPDDIFTAIKQLIDTALGRAKIQTGNYIGTGEYGTSHPNSLTFQFSPAVVIIGENEGNRRYGLFVRPAGIGMGIASTTSSHYVNSTWINNTLSWYAIGSGGEANQLNGRDITFYYVAIG